MDLFIYDWSTDEYNYKTRIRIWGLDKSNKTICLNITNFTPYVYIELPNKHPNWIRSNISMINSKINEFIEWKSYKPIKTQICMKKKLYYANVNTDYSYKKFPFILLQFRSSKHISSLLYKLRKSNNMIGSLKVKLHEQSAKPVLQLTCLKKIPTTGWITFSGSEIHEDECETYCNREFNVDCNHIFRNDNIDMVPQPYVLSFDIEVNSHNINKFPTGEHVDDKIFQISCIFSVQGTTNYEKILLTLGTPKPIKDTTIICYKSEIDLIIGFTKLVIKKNPQIILGYNILNFDMPYMIKRSLGPHCNCINEFSMLSCIKEHVSPVKKIKWSSSAYRNQEFEFLETPGRLFIDLLPIIKRDYKFNNYTLKLVSTFFLDHQAMVLFCNLLYHQLILL